MGIRQHSLGRAGVKTNSEASEMIRRTMCLSAHGERHVFEQAMGKRKGTVEGTIRQNIVKSFGTIRKALSLPDYKRGRRQRRTLKHLVYVDIS